MKDNRTNERSIAFILAAGIGKRLQPLTFDKPKPLIEVAGLPIIKHQLDALEACGITSVTIVLGYKSDLIIDALKNSHPNIKISFVKNEEYDSTNNIYSLYLAMHSFIPLLSNFDRVILVNGDIIFDKIILKNLLENRGNRIAVDKRTYIEESMKVVVKDDNIKKIAKTILKNEASGVSIDLYSFSINAWHAFSILVSDMIEKEALTNVWSEHALQRFLDQGTHKFVPMDIKGRYWFEIDNLDDLTEAERRFTLFRESPFLRAKKLFIFDLDGTILLGDSILPGSLTCINELMKRVKVVFLTNNSSMSTEQHLERLIQLLDIKLNIDNIYTSLMDTEQYLTNLKIKNIFLIATPDVQQEFMDAGFILNEDNPEAVVLTFDKTLTYSKLEKAAILLETKNMKFILTNSDIKCPTEHGFIPDAGSMAKLLELTTSHKIDVSRGKPNPEMINDLLRKNNLTKEDCVFFGDRLYTDIKMGEQSGVMTVLMLTGETKISDLDNEFFKKHLVFTNLIELHDYLKPS